MIERLERLTDLGLDYLGLNRGTDTPSGGESQRIKRVKRLSRSLVDGPYVFDEPSPGAAEALAGAPLPLLVSQRRPGRAFWCSHLSEKTTVFFGKKKRMRTHGHRARKRSDKGGGR